jgi:hypothetical protein
MQSFIQHHAERIKGVLSGLDRIRFRGTLRAIAHAWGLRHFLQATGVLLKDFKHYVYDNTCRLQKATQQLAHDQGRPFLYLARSGDSKEDLARDIARRDGITEGLIAIFRTVEPCWSFEVVSHPSHYLQLRACNRKCLHYYHYFQDAAWGLVHVRVQSWLPYFLHVCLNGREWLARQMDQAGLDYTQRDNCFVDVADFQRAQQLLDQQVHYPWSARLEALASQVIPPAAALLGDRPLPYYWSVNESEWATDVVFHQAADLARLYPRLLRHGIEVLSCRDVLRFLGRRQPEHCPTAAVCSDYRQRPEGVRLKHTLNHNVLKMYDKQAVVLRVETVINNPEDFKTYRAAEGNEAGTKAWRKLRKGVADLPRRLEVSQKANERYLEAQAAVEEKTALAELAAQVCRPVRWNGRRVRALNPLADADARLLTAVAQGEFALNGFRNRDIRALLYAQTVPSAAKVKSRSAAVTRQLRLLRAHGVIHKVAHTHRYVVSDHGRTTIAALLAARQADTAKLLEAA